MLEWLEVEENFDRLHGVGKTAVGAASNPTKKVVYAELGKYINQKSDKKVPGLTSVSMRGR